MSQRQQTIKRHFDQSASVKYFQKGQLVLLWNKAKEKPSLHTKFEALWIDPYMIKKCYGIQFLSVERHERNNPDVSSQWETPQKFYSLKNSQSSFVYSFLSCTYFSKSLSSIFFSQTDSIAQ
jgi:hypothetical protein